ncbi:hypothetical protein ACFL6C_06300, partial [Myxococcota bacterium]
IMAGAVLSESVPPRSLVKPGAVEVATREKPAQLDSAVNHEAAPNKPAKRRVKTTRRTKAKSTKR